MPENNPSWKISCPACGHPWHDTLEGHAPGTHIRCNHCGALLEITGRSPGRLRLKPIPESPPQPSTPEAPTAAPPEDYFTWLWIIFILIGAVFITRKYYADVCRYLNLSCFKYQTIYSALLYIATVITGFVIFSIFRGLFFLLSVGIGVVLIVDFFSK